MTQPANNNPQFISFQKDDASIVWIQRDSIVYFSQASVSYKTQIKLINGDIVMVMEKCADVEKKCNS